MVYELAIIRKMKETEEKYFAAALSYYIEKGGRGSETVLAIESGVPQPTISRIKNGHSHGLRSNCKKLADALGTAYGDMWNFGQAICSGQDPEGYLETFKKEQDGDDMQIRPEDNLTFQQYRRHFPEKYGRFLGQAEMELADLNKDDDKAEPG